MLEGELRDSESLVEGWLVIKYLLLPALELSVYLAQTKDMSCALSISSCLITTPAVLLRMVAYVREFNLGLASPACWDLK